MKKYKYKKWLCKCGHDHIAETGGKDGYTLTEERLEECINCNCDKFRKTNKLKNEKRISETRN